MNDTDNHQSSLLSSVRSNTSNNINKTNTTSPTRTSERLSSNTAPLDTRDLPTSEGPRITRATRASRRQLESPTRQRDTESHLHLLSSSTGPTRRSTRLSIGGTADIDHFAGPSGKGKKRVHIEDAEVTGNKKRLVALPPLESRIFDVVPGRPDGRGSWSKDRPFDQICDSLSQPSQCR